MISTLFFLGWSVFCWWVIFRDGATALEGWASFFVLGWRAAALTADELKLYVGISWIASLVVFVVSLV
jgi:hypothetical protein